MLIRQTVSHQVDETELAPLAAIAPQLVLVFAAPRFFRDGELAACLSRVFPHARRVGCSTAGEISDKGVAEDGLVVTALRFEKVTVRISQAELADMDDSRAAGARLAAGLPDARAVLMFAPGVAVNGSELIAGATTVLGPDVALAGGLAGDYGRFQQTWTLLDDQVSDRRVVGIGLGGEHLVLGRGSRGGWRGFGPARVVTRARDNILFELDGQPALEVYKRYLGEYARELPASGLLFPFALLSDDQQESGLIRTLLGVDEADGSLILAGDVPEGGHVRLMHAAGEALVDGAEAAARLCREIQGQPRASLALLVSCVGRKLVLGDRVDEEVEAVAAALGPQHVLTGFYSNGEIGPDADGLACHLHNQTMTITCLGER